MLAVVLSEERGGDFQVVFEGLGRVRMFQVSRCSENDVSGNDVTVDDFLVNHVGTRWRLLITIFETSFIARMMRR